MSNLIQALQVVSGIKHVDGNNEKKVTLTPLWIHFMHCVQRAGNNAQERRQSEPQGVKQKCGCETLAKGSTRSL